MNNALFWHSVDLIDASACGPSGLMQRKIMMPEVLQTLIYSDIKISLMERMTRLSHIPRVILIWWLSVRFYMNGNPLLPLTILLWCVRQIFNLNGVELCHFDLDLFHFQHRIWIWTPFPELDHAFDDIQHGRLWGTKYLTRCPHSFIQTVKRPEYCQQFLLRKGTGNSIKRINFIRLKNFRTAWHRLENNPFESISNQII